MRANHRTFFQIVDQTLGSLHKNVQKQWTDIRHLCSSVNEVPNLIIRVQELMEEISKRIFN